MDFFFKVSQLHRKSHCRTKNLSTKLKVCENHGLLLQLKLPSQELLDLAFGCGFRFPSPWGSEVGVVNCFLRSSCLLSISPCFLVILSPVSWILMHFLSFCHRNIVSPLLPWVFHTKSYIEENSNRLSYSGSGWLLLISAWLASFECHWVLLNYLTFLYFLHCTLLVCY
jgi:hypothetical protein